MPHGSFGVPNDNFGDKHNAPAIVVHIEVNSPNEQPHHNEESKDDDA
jgi:hypothetical protein